MLAFLTAAHRRAMLLSALLLMLAGPTPSWAAGAFAIGKCGAYGQAYDFAGEADARAAARKQC